MKRCFAGKNANISVQNIGRVSDSGGLYMDQSLRKVKTNTYQLEFGAIYAMLPKLIFCNKILYTYPSFWLNLLCQHFSSSSIGVCV